MTGKDKKKEGEIIEIDRANNRAKVKEVNMVKKHLRPTQENPQGGINEMESPIHISNVKLFINDKATRVGYKILENGKKVRFAKTTGEMIS